MKLYDPTIGSSKVKVSTCGMTLEHAQAQRSLKDWLNIGNQIDVGVLCPKCHKPYDEHVYLDLDNEVARLEKLVLYNGSVKFADIAILNANVPIESASLRFGKLPKHMSIIDPMIWCGLKSVQ